MRSPFPIALMALFAVAAPRPALAVPAEVGNVQWCVGTKTCLSWSAATGATQYRLYRGEGASLPCVLNVSLDSCADGVFGATTTGGVIVETPAAGRFFWFLVTAADGSGEGTTGSATAIARDVDVTGACFASCAAAGSGCSTDGDCCSSLCIAGTCIASCCQSNLAACTTALDCCSGICGAGACQSSCAGAADCPPPEAECKTRSCAGGMCGFTNAPLGTACTQNGGTVCDFAGNCVQCLAASQCPGTDTECRSRSCTSETCGFTNAPSGTITSTQTAGDCRRNVCDGSGNTTVVNDNADIPVDGNQCTNDVCTNGTPSNPLVPQGSPCSQSGGTVCDFAGNCVQCLAASQCPGTDTECRSRSCTSETCGFTNAPSGTITSTQTSGDCRRNVCDGSGNAISVNDNADVPVDGNQCTNDVCNNGTPSNPLAPQGTACNQSGGTVCDFLGNCVQCLSASQCPGTDTQCQSRRCASETCGFANAPAGTTCNDSGGTHCDGAGLCVP